MYFRRAALLAAIAALFLGTLAAVAQDTAQPVQPAQPAVPPAPPAPPQPPPAPPPPTVPYWWLTQPSGNAYGQQGYGQNSYGQSSVRTPYWFVPYGGTNQNQPASGSSTPSDSHHKESGGSQAIRPVPVYPSASASVSPDHYYAPAQNPYSQTSVLRSGSYSSTPYGGSSSMPYGGMGGSYGSKKSMYSSAGSYSSGSAYNSLSAPVVDAGLYDNFFQPSIVNITPGTVVRWTNRGQHHHTVTSDNDLWDSGELRPGEGYAVHFPLPGTYYYHCKVHDRFMKGWVVVRSNY